ncbi:DNA-directed RNA polymerase V subunit 1 [Euphorbia lathyris]|uniref:DNA-directed RNA polymerase V subunit 1 n=1 Tax=Euphorbia lathyris TaxID=212925 RepID=UPI003313F02C
MEEKVQEKAAQPTILEGELVGIRFGLASHKEISTASVNGCSINHSSQLTNPFLGLPLEFGKCESCGTAEIGQCEGHFGYIELPIPIYHPSHVAELKRLLGLLCLKCLKLKTNKIPKSGGGVAERLMSCCEDASQIVLKEIKIPDGSSFLALKFSRNRFKDGVWNFLERYGFRYGDDLTRTLLPCEVMEMLKRIPLDARKRLARRGYFPQDGYIMKYLPVPPNCLSVPDVSDGISVMSSDLSISMLKKVLKQVEIIKSSRAGAPNFESHEVEARDLQSVVDQYLQLRGASKSARDVGERFGVHTESNESSTKAWLEKMRTLFIRKGSGFSSRSVITGDAYTRVDQIGLPFEIAQRITFEERVNVHNVKFLQELVDNKLCLTYRDGSTIYSLREGSKGHTFLRPGQVVHRRIMDGDTVFINRPPTTHKHSLQALSVYVHDDHTVKINPLICGPLSADFDGDCIHLFYPQSLGAKAEVMELFTVEKQLLSSHSGNLNLQLTSDSLLSLKTMFKGYFFNKAAAQQLGMFISSSLPLPAFRKSQRSGPIWTALQMLQTALPSDFDCIGERYFISKGDMVNLDFSREIMQPVINEIVISIFFEKGPAAVFKFFNSLQPLLMENLFAEGFSVGLRDFYMSRGAIEKIRRNIKKASPFLGQLRSRYNELVEVQLLKHIRDAKRPVEEYILSSSALGDLVDPKSESAVTKVVQQIGFLGLQIADRGKFYSKTLFEDMAAHYEIKYPSDLVDSPAAKHGLVHSCFFLGLDPYEEMAHSISTREIIVRSSRGLSEPGTLFKNLMAILRDVVICYDGTVRNLCSNTIIQFEYGLTSGIKAQSLFPAGEPVGVLAATAMSNPAYKAVLDSSPSSNSSWDMMKEILLSKVNFKNDDNDRRVILYLNACACGGKYCQENSSCVVKSHLKKVILKDIANCLLIEYKSQQIVADSSVIGHIHLNKEKLLDLNVSMEAINEKCLETIKLYAKKNKKKGFIAKVDVSFSDYCTFEQPCSEEWPSSPCVSFFSHDAGTSEVEEIIHLFADVVCPVLLDTIIKGDHRISSANIIRVSPDTTTWIRNPSRNQKTEFALDVVIEKKFVKQSGDAWRIALDACLPVFHLIDTTRSLPYAIKQVQELLGISCAFDQAAQRLSSSVKMVAKGVLKEHLILLANSMTCAGNLVGFNSGGYKALSRSLDIQVPFTEATLFTPRRCFERAAEKCHTDSLSSVVASCSWGKHVAVGTGSRFDLLWDQKEANVNQEESINVYEFLNMVRPGASGEEPIPACLGAEVDDLMLDDEENDDWNLSPDRTMDTDKPMFEDHAEFEKYAENGASNGGNWGAGESTGASSGGWNTAPASQTDAGDSWGADKKVGADKGWGTGTASETTDIGNSWGNKSAGAEKETAWSGWGKKTSESETAQPDSGKWGDTNAGAEKETAGSGWGKKTTEAAEKDIGSTWGDKSAGADTETASSGWGKKTSELAATDTGSAWGAKSAGAEKETAGSGWGKSSWGDKGAGAEKETVGSGWGKKTTETAQTDIGKSWGAGADKEAAGSGWGKKASETPQADFGKSWGDKSAGADKETSASGWGKKTSEAAETDNGSSWGAKSVGANKETAGSVWGKKTSEKEDAFSTQAAEHVESPVSNSGWGKRKSPENSQGWGSKTENSQGWGSKTENSQGWGSKTEASEHVESPASNMSWGKLKSSDNSQGWGSKTENSQGWGSKTENSQGWGSKSENSQGWGSRKPEREWKINKNRPAKPFGTNPDESSNIAAMFTLTRQRLDLFTSDEQDILSEVEPLMRSIRRIMHKSGYNDEDPLSPTDQAYILDNVFNHHPDKDAKMGAGVDHFMINKHDVFSESKCFYVVSTDGSKHDFSYRKCLENFVKGKYPELAEEFIPKYFVKPRPRSQSQQPQTPLTQNLEESQKPEETPLTQNLKESEKPEETPLTQNLESEKPEETPLTQNLEESEKLEETPLTVNLEESEKPEETPLTQNLEENEKPENPSTDQES